ncbi:hypothetical protein JOB18_012186 [Solea senegalensis]|uniref:BED-type domain-containing protein n=1 Tax=Solea senegalensis TaxID=28829 RepID=A0AAV6S376_SOLSE|nr:hypothetical protein JOB18_012186 [Solea senegalensis]
MSCKVCFKTVATKGSTTANLFHLKNKHAAEWEQCVALQSAKKDNDSPQTTQRQVTLAASLAHNTPYETKGKKWKHITDADNIQTRHCGQKRHLRTSSFQDRPPLKQTGHSLAPRSFEFDTPG